MKAELRDSLENIFPDSKISSEKIKTHEVDVARGGVAALHILCNELQSGQILSFTADFSLSSSVPAWFNLIDVPVEENTGLTGFVERNNKKNPFAIRRAPFRAYDAMEPVNKAVKISSTTMALRLHLPIPRSAKKGSYSCRITIKSGKDFENFIFNINVYKAEIPKTGKNSWPYTNWFSLSNMAKYHKIKLWSNAHFEMIEKYAALMVHARQNTFLLPLEDICSRVRTDVKLNRSRLYRLVNIFTKAGMYYIEGGHFAGRTGGAWNSPTFSVVLKGDLVTSLNGHRDIAEIARQLMEEIRKNRWEKRWIQHSADEPTEVQAQNYRSLVGIMRKYMPGIPILDATMHPDLAGTCNYWCPKCREYQLNQASFEALRKFGDKLWVYTCCEPGGSWLNRLLDQELLRPVFLGWAGALFNIDGFLHWGLNQYRTFQDPFKLSVVKHGTFVYLPAGDTHIVYPGKNAPWSSLRLEAEREGCEDYELLQLLKQKNKPLANKIIKNSLRSFNNYTKSTKVFRKTRKLLLTKLSGK